MMRFVRVPVVAALFLMVLTVGTTTGPAIHGVARADNATPTVGATAAATAAPTAAPTAVPTPHIPPPAAPQNVVKVTNQTSNRLAADGKVQLNRLPGSRIAPLNEAYAYASCTACQTVAIALQIDLVGKKVTYDNPQNVALAINYKCTHCTTIAKAYQYVIQESNPHQVPHRVNDLVAAMNRELSYLHGRNITAAQAAADIENVINQFSDLAKYLQTETSQTTKSHGKQRHAHKGKP